MHPILRVSLLCAALAFATTVPAFGQLVPWLEPTAPAETTTAREAPATERPTRPAPRARPALDEPIIIGLEKPDTDRPWLDIGDLFTLSIPSTLPLSSFSGGSADGAVRAGTTWVGQTTQGAGTLAVAGTARDDNGWGTTGLSLDASGMTYLNITAQRTAGNLAETLFIQFEDLSLRTKVVSVSTSHFALGSQTLVQVPLTGWTLDFGPSQITGWNLGGGGVGTVDFRMSFDSLAFTTTAIPEPATYAALLGALSLVLTWRRRRAGPSRVSRANPR